MSICDIEDMEKAYRCSTSTQRQLDLQYQMYRSLKCAVEKLYTKLCNYDVYASMVKENSCSIEEIEKMVKLHTKVINQIIDNIKCVHADFDKRLSALENKKMIENVEKI